MVALSAVLITKNEEKNIDRCLDSLEAVCEEIVVMDAYSEDRTAAMCRARKVRFYQRSFDSFQAQKKAALALSTHAHILALDADECLSDRLIESILEIKEKGFQYTGYRMKRLSFYKERPIRTCGWYPNFQLRLWEKKYGTWSHHLLHEHIVLASGSSCGTLRGDLLHYAYQNPSHMQRKALYYTDLYASEHRFRNRIGLIGTIFKAWFAFWRTYLLQGGYKEGYVGLLISWMISNGTFYKYIKLIEANRSLRCSMIITTYNHPLALKAVLDSIRRQSLLPVEVIVADDGSEEATRQLITQEQSTFPVPLYHCWQPDQGFRASRSRNMALSQAQGEYIMFLDGDLLLHPHFVRDHQRHCRKGWGLQGSRIMLNASQTQKILQKGWHSLSFWQRLWIRSLKGMYVSFFSRLFSYEIRGAYGVRGGLSSFWKEDVYAVNGYNEAYEGWGREDSDFFTRIQQHGVRIKKLKLTSISYHLKHEKESRKDLHKNDTLLAKTLQEKRIRCQKGLDAHLKKPKVHA